MAATMPAFSDGTAATAVAEPAAAPLYGFTESGTRAHLLADPATRRALCGLLLDHIPLTQTGPAARCRRCDTIANTSPHLLVTGPAEEPADDQVGVCSHCGGEAAVNDHGLVIPHGVVRMRDWVQMRTSEPCPGAGHAPEDIQ